MIDHKQSRRISAVPLALACLVSGSLWPARADVSQTSKKQPPVTGGKSASGVQKIGEVTLSHTRLVTTTVSRDGKSFDADIVGNPSAVAKSARYDISGQRIQLSFKAGLVRTGTATGGVEVHIRNPEQEQHATLTCTTAHYFGATPAEPAHMHLTGPVHVVQYAPQFAEPLDGTGDSCDVILLADGGYSISLSNGGATVTPIEPAPKTSK